MDLVAALAALRSGAHRDDPYPIYAALHALGEAGRPTGAGEIYTAVAYGYDVVERALRDPALRVSDSHHLDRVWPTWRESPTWHTLTGSMMFANPPAHTRLRHIVGQAFTPRRMAALEPAIRRLIAELLDRLETRGGPVDFLTEFAFPLPSDVIGELLGVPEADRAWFRPKVEAIGAILDLGAAPAGGVALADAAATALRDYFTDLAARRRAHPRDDLVSVLVRDAALTDDELLGNLVVLFNAGFVTTTHLLGNGLALLLERPGAVAAIRADPAAAPAYIEEILRFESPVQLVTRWAAEPTVVGGVPVPPGGRVLVLLGAANRDPRRFPDPDRFAPTRPDNRPLSFGAGIHYCVGAALSRLEARIAFPLLFTRFPGLAIAERPTRSGQLTLRGFTKLPITTR